MKGCYFSTITLVARRSAVGDSCRFAEDITVYEDWEFTGHLAKRGPGAYLDCEAALQHSHTGPRLTDVDSLRRAVNSLLVLKRVWGSDAQILSRHRDAYRRMFERWEVLRIRQLIACGRTREARAALRAEPQIGIFWPYRALATLPGTLAVPLTRAGRLARTVLKRGSLSEWFGFSGSCSPSAGTGPACREW
jgi:hypothetical protein